ncbi:MAG TPA: hypothetical protein PK530_12745 [Anaerolineales bacterium]|nr:hypothetical protein [Anaerolineales bacterium]
MILVHILLFVSLYPVLSKEVIAARTIASIFIQALALKLTYDYFGYEDRVLFGEDHQDTP